MGFGKAYEIIRKYALQSDLKQLYCFRRLAEVSVDKFKLLTNGTTTDWQQIAHSTQLDFERLSITKLFRSCTIASQKYPGPVYVLSDVKDA